MFGIGRLLWMWLVPASVLQIGSWALADAKCTRTDPFWITQEKEMSGKGTRCLTLKLLKPAALLTVSIKAISGSYDLYLAQGQYLPQGALTTLTDANDKINTLGVDSGAGQPTFGFLSPEAGTYTLGVKNLAAADGRFWLSVQVGAISDQGTASTTECAGDVCTHTVPLTLELKPDVPIGSEFGSQGIFPLRVTCPGTLRSSAFWEGSAQGLALILNGPGQVGYYVRQDGPSPLAIEYEVKAEDVQKGSLWQIRLVNFRGGEAKSQIRIELPDSECLRLYRIPLRLRLLPLTPRPTELLRAHSVSDLHFDPPRGASLAFGQSVQIRFRYSTAEAGGVRIHLRPMTAGQPSPNYAASGSALYPQGSGEGSADFTLRPGAAPVVVDQIRVQIYSADQTKLLAEQFFAVNYRFGF